MNSKDKKINILVSRHYDLLSQFVFCITGKKYTHASIGLEDDKDTFYSFNGKGFRIEKPGLWKKKNNKIIAIAYEINVDEDAYEKAKQFIEDIKEHQNDYHYSFLGLALCILHIPHKLQHKYFCSQFVGEVLDNSGLLDDTMKSSLLLPNTISELLQNMVAREYCVC